MELDNFTILLALPCMENVVLATKLSNDSHEDTENTVNTAKLCFL